MNYWRFAAVLACFAVVCSADAQIVQIPLTREAPVINGVIDEAEWATSRALGPFHRAVANTSAVAMVATNARIMRDDGWLYIAIRCDEPNRVGLKRTVTRPDGPVTMDDCIEVFLDPGTGGKRYVHLMLSAGSVRADQLCSGSERDRNWNMPWLGVAKQDPHTDSATGWSAEVAIPLIALPRGSGEWKFNLGRARAAATPTEYYTLAALPPGVGFHSPQHFSTMDGMASVTPAMVFCPTVDAIKLGNLHAEKDGFSYGVEVAVANTTGQSGLVDLIIRDRPYGGRPSPVTTLPVQLPSNGVRRVIAKVNISSVGPRDATVELRDPASGYVFQSVAIDRMEMLNPFAAYLDRSYYSTESRVRIHADISYDAAGLTLVAALADGPESKVQVAGAEAFVDLPIAGLPPGDHPVTVRLIHGDANLGTATLTFRKLAPVPSGGNELKVDHYNRSLILNGKHWFPVGAFGLGYHGNLVDFKLRMMDRQFQICQDAGLDFVADWAGIGAEGRTMADAKLQYDLAHKYGMKVYALPFGYTHELSYHNPKFIDNALKHITTIDPFLEMCRVHPAVIGYYQFDEPPPGAGIDRALAALADKLHAANPHHLVYMSLTRVVHESQRNWVGTLTDLLGAHNYWYVEKPQGLLANADSFHELDQYAQSRRTPTMHAPQLDCWGSGYEGGGFMTHQEQRAQTWLAVIHGARSLMYFVLPFRSVQSVRTQREICDQLDQFSEALVRREPAQSVTFDPVDAVSATTNRWPLVHTSIRRFPDGRLLVLAMNTSWAAGVDVKYRLAGLGAGSTVRSVVEEPGDKAVRDGAFSDTIQPWGTRAYIISGVSLPEAAPITMHLSMSGEATRSPTASAAPAGPVSLLPNGGFENNNGWAVNKEHGGNATMRFDTGNPHSGSRSMAVTNADPGGSADVASDYIELQPGKHRFTAFMRSAITQGRQMPSVTILSEKIVAGQYVVNAMNGVDPKLPADQWNKVVGHFTVPDGLAQRIRVWLRMPRGTVGTTWFDDLTVESLVTPTLSSASKRKNLVVNASFERHRVEGYPSGWIPAVSQYLIGEEKGCSTVTDNPVHGKYCYRIVKEDNAYVYAAPATPVAVSKNTNYTVSVYMRADRDNASVTAYIPGGPRSIRLGTEWKRYSLTFNTGEASLASFGYYPDGDMTIWFDAAQLEEGDQATEFESTP